MLRNNKESRDYKVRILSSSLKEKAEKILELLNRLATESAKGVLIIVEGQNDIDTLRELSVSGKIICAKTSGKAFLDVIGEMEGTGESAVILLMDFDRRGKEWTQRLAQHLERIRIKPNLLFWKGLLSLVGHDVKDIEGLATYLETLRKKLGA